MGIYIIHTPKYTEKKSTPRCPFRSKEPMLLHFRRREAGTLQVLGRWGAGAVEKSMVENREIL